MKRISSSLTTSCLIEDYLCKSYWSGDAQRKSESIWVSFPDSQQFSHLCYRASFHSLGPHFVRSHSGRLAYWAINNLLYVLQMLHKWAVFYHYFLTLGPLGWQAKTQICLQPAFSGKRESCPLEHNHIPACIVNFSDVLVFLFLHSNLIWPQWKMMWCIF